MPKFWETQIGDLSFSLYLENDKWIIRYEGKTILRYNEDKAVWLGVKNGKVVSIVWPTFREIIANYMLM